MLKVDTYIVKITKFPDGTKRIEIPSAVFMPTFSEKVFEHPITKERLEFKLLPENKGTWRWDIKGDV